MNREFELPLSGTRGDVASKFESFKGDCLPIGLESVLYVRGWRPKGRWARFLEWLGRRCFAKIGFERF